MKLICYYINVMCVEKTSSDSLVDDVCMYSLYFWTSQASWLVDYAKHEGRIYWFLLNE